MTVPTPTVDIVQAAVAHYSADPRNALADRTLRMLFDTYPLNSDAVHVLHKVALLNALYSTQIYDVITVAQHIVSREIDSRLKAGDLNLVAEVAKVTFKNKVRTNYSFATKYCSWHSAESFPIYDDFVRKRLLAYQKIYPFAEFTAETLKDYKAFVKVLASFRDKFKLSSVCIRDIDKFLWLEGKNSDGQQQVPASAPCAARSAAAEPGRSANPL